MLDAEYDVKMDDVLEMFLFNCINEDKQGITNARKAVSGTSIYFSSIAQVKPKSLVDHTNFQSKIWKTHSNKNKLELKLKCQHP